MMFPFMNIMREEDGEIVEEVVSELPAKSLTEICAQKLKHANHFMDTFFKEEL